MERDELESWPFPEGDARVCPAHPHVRTSSADGLHDGPCGQCEHEMWVAYDQEEYQDADTEPMGTPLPVLPVVIPDYDTDDIPF